MRVKFLGTSSAWPWPNPCCPCSICVDQRESKDPRDTRKRTSLLLKTESKKNILVDCGPDFAEQSKLIKDAKTNTIISPDALIITHTHPDHLAGIDDLTPTSYIRGKPIPTYAHPDVFGEMERTGKAFYYGVLSILEKKEVDVGQTINLFGVEVSPFKTFHGSFAPGACGFIFDEGDKRIVYTSDFSKVIKGEELIIHRNIGHLILDCNWFNEPLGRDNQGHLSFQASLPFLEKWNPESVHYTHFGIEDWVEDDPVNEMLLKRGAKVRPKEPLRYLNRAPYKVPRTYAMQEKLFREVLKDNGLEKYANQIPPIVSYDGLEI